ncbi:hypothetical protein MRB53_040976 [Persea americana]|nr:hypothetical protein MRB53_040976 [Persea americana]
MVSDLSDLFGDDRVWPSIYESSFSKGCSEFCSAMLVLLPIYLGFKLAVQSVCMKVQKMILGVHHQIASRPVQYADAGSSDATLTQGPSAL